MKQFSVRVKVIGFCAWVILDWMLIMSSSCVEDRACGSGNLILYTIVLLGGITPMAWLVMVIAAEIFDH